MARPHPAVWRVIHGMVVIYLLVLVFLLFQNVDDARQMMRVRWGLANRLTLKACRVLLSRPCRPLCKTRCSLHQLKQGLHLSGTLGLA